MDYVTEEIPEELIPSFEEEIYPTLYINTDSLRKQSSLVVVMTSDYSLYVMGSEIGKIKKGVIADKTVNKTAGSQKSQSEEKQ